MTCALVGEREEGFMRIAQLLALVLLGFALSGCATIIKGTTQSISVATPPANGAMCERKAYGT